MVFYGYCYCLQWYDTSNSLFMQGQIISVECKLEEQKKILIYIDWLIDWNSQFMLMLAFLLIKIL